MSDRGGTYQHFNMIKTGFSSVVIQTNAYVHLLFSMDDENGDIKTSFILTIVNMKEKQLVAQVIDECAETNKIAS